MAAKPIWTNAQIVDQLDSGLHWSGSNLTFGFPSDAGWFPYAEKDGFSALNDAQKIAATLAISLWDDLIAPDFALAANGANANIKISNTTTDIGYAHAYYPGGWAGAGSIWLNPAYGAGSGTNNLVTPVVGQWGFQAYIHEIGHALGLDHPGEYNGGSPTYENDALYAQDSQQYTLMSYFTASNTGADWIASDGRSYYAQTPMLHDVMAIQAVYGADTGTRTGNTTYGFNANAGAWVYDFTQNLHPVVCIYDAGGSDTLDLSGWSYSCAINLTPGSFSNADMMTYNISIAFDTWIEGAVGGAGADTLLGSTINNILDGRSGADSLSGGGGNDIFVYKIGYGADVITDFSGDIIDLSTIAAIVDFAAVQQRASQVGANTVINFGGGNTLTLQNVTLATLTTGNFDYFGEGVEPNAPPSAITLANLNVSENVAGASVGAIGVADPNGDTAFTFQLSDARFQVVGGPGAYQLKLVSGIALDFETEPTINVTITARDAGGLAIEKLFTLSVLDAAGATITGTASADVINASRTVGSQAFVTGENDTVYGMGGNDNISGLGGDDYLRGDAGNDTLNGDGGNDTLEGGAGTDTLNGGEGNDTFVVSATNDAADSRNGGAGSDRILMSGAGALTLNSFNAAASSIELWQGNGQAVLGTTAANGFNFSGLAAVTGLAYVDGGSGNDSITGSQFADDLRGGAGNDTLVGGEGNDTLAGGAGTDNVNGGGGHDTIVVVGAEAQSDTISGGEGQDAIRVVGASNLTLAGFNAAGASIESWQGNGLAVIGTTAANVYDFSGLQGVSGLAYVDGNSGNDSITGSWFVDDLRGGAGNDTLSGGEGGDTLAGGAGVDTVNGGGGNDLIVVTGTEAQIDLMWGGEGLDSVQVVKSSNLTLAGFNAAASSIEVWQGNGAAVVGTNAANLFNFAGLESVTGLAYVDGGSGNDTITGTRFADDLRGGAGNDVLHGGEGDDRLNGGNNNDTLTGGLGRDTLVGGAAGDLFVFAAYADSSVGVSADVITDFSISQLDKIDLSALDAKVGTDGNDVFSFIGGGAFTGEAGQLRFANGVLAADSNGDGVSDFEIVVTGVTVLSANSFVL